MMDTLLQWLADLATRIQLVPLAKSTANALLVYGGFLVIVYLLERRAGAGLARYRSRNFGNDVLYMLLYRGGFFNIFVLAAITNALDAHVGFLRVKLLSGVPWPVGLALFWVGGDFLLYWLHRLQHSNRFLWALHSVHHSQSELTLLTAWRRHPLEMLLTDLFLYIGVFNMLLGVPTRGWLPLAVALTCLQALHHSQLDWRYGRLSRWVVSPHFHAFHHSVDRRQSDANFGLMFSCWDYLFGTAVDAPERPARYGVDGIEYRESLTNQLIDPVRLAWRWRRSPEAAPASPQASAPQASAPLT
jgi:sterol desaturase/sphingolipid hydroxylase (fatty acid hydroxylase superfamily)